MNISFLINFDWKINEGSLLVMKSLDVHWFPKPVFGFFWNNSKLEIQPKEFLFWFWNNFFDIQKIQNMNSKKDYPPVYLWFKFLICCRAIRHKEFRTYRHCRCNNCKIEISCKSQLKNTSPPIHNCFWSIIKFQS